MSDAFSNIFGGNRGVYHLRTATSEDTRSFSERVRAFAAALAAGEARYAGSIESLADAHELSVAAYAMHGSTGAPDGELAMELSSAHEEEPCRALVLLHEDALAAMAGGRLFILDHEFEVQR